MHTQRTLTPGRVAGCAARVVSPHPRARCCAYRSSLRRIMALPAPHRGISPGHVALVSLYNPAAKPPSCHDTIYCIATHSPNSQALARAARPCARAGRVAGQVLGCIVAQSGRIVADHPRLLLPLSRYSLLYRDSKQKMDSSPACCLQRFFFHIIFFLIPATGKPQKKYLFIYLLFFFQ